LTAFALQFPAPFLRSFDPFLPTFVTTDASGYALGAVLEQEESSHRRPVAFFSRSMQAAEQNHHPQEEELLAVVYSLRHWRAYLHRRNFTVFTSHESLKYLQTQDYLVVLEPACAAEGVRLYVKVKEI
jgi:hypothetical protein